MDDFKRKMRERCIALSIASIKFSEGAREHPLLRTMADQYIRSATSIGANFIEAQVSSSRKDYARYFRIALRSANESEYWLILIESVSATFAKDAAKLRHEVHEIALILGKSLISLKNSP